MTQKLTPRKRLSIVRLYLSGLSYDDTASRTGVGKGTVASVVGELKAGIFPEAADVREQVDMLRELSLDLKRINLTPGQCATGLAVLSRISECGLDASDIDRWPMILRSVPDQEDAKEFVRLVYSITEVLQRSGLSLEGLDSTVRELEKKAADLQPMSDKVEDCQRQLAELKRQREKQASSVAMLEQRRKLLSPHVKDLERRERTLSRRIADMEPKAQKAEATISSLRSQTQALEDIGFSTRELAGFCERLQVIAQRHSVGPGDLRVRLLGDLETLDKGLSLETLLQTRQQQLEEAEKALGTAKDEIEATRAVVDNLKQEKMGLESSIREIRDAVCQEIATIIPLAQETVQRLAACLRQGTDEALAEVGRLKDEAIAAGIEVGRCQGVLQVNEWLKDLTALVHGEEDIEGRRVRIIVLPVVRSLSIWLRHRHSSYLSSQSVMLAAESLVRCLESWEI